MRTCSRAFLALITIGLAVEGTAGWLVYIWAARVLPCRFSPAQAVLGRSSVCPVPVTLFGHNSFVPVFMLTALLLASIVLFVVSFARITVATLGARRTCTLHRIVSPAVLSSVRSAKWLLVVDDAAPTAYCIGLLRPWVVITSGLVERLTEPSLRAVVAHETSHRRRRDPFRSALAMSVARGLFFVPSLRDLAAATSAENEISADAKAVGLVGRANLVTGLLAVLGHPAPTGFCFDRDTRSPPGSARRFGVWSSPSSPPTKDAPHYERSADRCVARHSGLVAQVPPLAHRGVSTANRPDRTIFRLVRASHQHRAGRMSPPPTASYRALRTSCLERTGGRILRLVGAPTPCEC